MGLDPVLLMPKSCPLGRLVCHSIVLLIFKFFFVILYKYGQLNIGCKNKIELFSFIGKKKKKKKRKEVFFFCFCQELVFVEL